MVTCREWENSAFSRDRKASQFADDLLDPKFWKDCNDVVYFTEPLVRVLRIVDSEDRLAMGYLYAAFHRARENMITRLNARKKKVDDYFRIVDTRWDNQLKKDIHAAGFWLNPGYRYNLPEMEKHKQTTSGLLDVIERYVGSMKP